MVTRCQNEVHIFSWRQSKNPKQTLNTYLETAEKPCSNLPLPQALASSGVNGIQVSQMIHKGLSQLQPF